VIPWAVRYDRDQRGRLPVADFFELPSTIGITKVERAKFFMYLMLVREQGLGLIARSSSVLEPSRGETNLSSIRLRRTTNNPRVLACSLAGHRCIVLLHAFKGPVRTAENSRSLDPVATSSSQTPKPGSTSASESRAASPVGGQR
jgi:hypothetical protein